MDNTRHVPRATSASFRAYAFIGAQRTGLFLSFRLREKETIPDKFITRHLAAGILERVKGFRFRDNSLLKSLIHHENFEQLLTENRSFERYSSILLKLEGD